MIPITEDLHDLQNSLATHPLQTYEWGEFRKKTGVTVIRYCNDKKTQVTQLTLHPIPHTPWQICYFPKGPLPTSAMLQELSEINRGYHSIFTQIEPNISSRIYTNSQGSLSEGISHLSQQERDLFTALNLRPATRPLFTKYNFILDLSKSEEELLKNMHAKTRYNIRVAQKHNVEISEDSSPEAFTTHLTLTKQTTNRQRFFAHSEKYHKMQWETLKHTRDASNHNQLTSHLFLAKYQGEVLASWIIFIFKDTIYYPYGASSNEHREVMASNLLMWEIIRFGKKHSLQRLDMWGALSPTPDSHDPWYGFHRFKLGYGADLHESLGNFDLVVNKALYQSYRIADKIRWLILKQKA